MLGGAESQALTTANWKVGTPIPNRIKMHFGNSRASQPTLRENLANPVKLRDVVGIAILL